MKKFEFRNIIQSADSVEYTAKKYDRSCMGRRNSRLVEQASSFCICYYDIAHKSGTAQTVKMAKEKMT